MENLVDRTCKKNCDRFNLHDKKIAVEKLTGLSLLNERIPEKKDLAHFNCLHCNISFSTQEEMSSHFQSDGHVKTLKTSKSNAHKQASGVADDDDDSLSDIDEPLCGESDDENAPYQLTTLASSSGKQILLFRNYNSEIVGLHRCVLYYRNNRPETADELFKRVAYARKSKVWAIMLYSGGKFAAAVFEEKDVVAHKTFRRYTVRAKQGGSQSAKDSACGGMSGPKSAGAALRRAGEAAIKSDIAGLLHSKWLRLLQSCDLIFVWTPASHRKIFFTAPSHVPSADAGDSDAGEAGTDALPSFPASPLAQPAVKAGLGFTSEDPRLRFIPYRVRGITFECIRELHKDISQFEVYDKTADPDLIGLSERRQTQLLATSKQPVLKVSESGAYFYEPLGRRRPGKKRTSVSSDTSQQEPDSPDPVTLNQSQLLEEQRKQEYLATVEETRSRLASLCVQFEQWHRKVRVAVAAGDSDTLTELLKLTPEQDATQPSQAEVAELLNHPLSDGRTLLHVAVEFQVEPSMIQRLLQFGCNPSKLDSEEFSPYKRAQDLGLRYHMKMFKRFRADHPDKYDYEKSDIPPVQEEASDNAALRAKRKAQKERLLARHRAEAEAVARAEEAVRFSKLSDREKRALAAERRMKTVSGACGQQRLCDQCRQDMTGKVPFTYAAFNFCTAACMKNHRLSKILSK